MVLIDAKITNINLISLARKVLVLISIDLNLPTSLNKSFMILIAMMKTYLPASLLTKRDPCGPTRVHRVLCPVSRWFSRRLPNTDEHSHASNVSENAPNVVKLIWLVLIPIEVSIHAFDIDNISLARTHIEGIAGLCCCLKNSFCKLAAVHAHLP